MRLHVFLQAFFVLAFILTTNSASQAQTGTPYSFSFESPQSVTGLLLILPLLVLLAAVALQQAASCSINVKMWTASLQETYAPLQRIFSRFYCYPRAVYLHKAPTPECREEKASSSLLFCCRFPYWRASCF